MNARRMLQDVTNSGDGIFLPDMKQALPCRGENRLTLRASSATILAPFSGVLSNGYDPES